MRNSLSQPPKAARKPNSPILSFLLFLVIVLLAAAAVAGFRDGLLVVLTNFYGLNEQLPLLHTAASVLAVFAAFILVLIAEPYLRIGARRGLLLPRFLCFAIPLAVFAGVWYGLFLLLR
ncbi:MAG: hypothetical protein M1296_07480 [Chloroflexi bacterium]|nr:hypothetical protein [Chloroflexota bacterium]